jgi:hypothetical protein
VPSCCALPYGSNLNHCPKCHQTFSSLHWFDKHQDVNYDRTPAVVCKTRLTELGLVKDLGGTWCTPQAAVSRQAQSVRLAVARSRRTS